MSLRRQRGLWLGVAAIMVILGGLVTAGVGPAVGAAAPQLTAARSIPGLNALNAGGNARVNSVSCGTPGTCVAAGSYTDTAGNLLPFVADETNGTWGQANSVAGIPELNLGKNAGATSISCAAPGSCSASGSYTDAHGDHPSWISYVNSKGFWNPALAEPGTSGGGLLEVGAPPQITVSCGAPGNCAAAGWTDITPTRARTSFLVDEVNFTWSASHDVPGLAADRHRDQADADLGVLRHAGQLRVRRVGHGRVRARPGVRRGPVGRGRGGGPDPDRDEPGPVRGYGDVRAGASRADLGQGHGGIRRHAAWRGHRHGGQGHRLPGHPRVGHEQLPADAEGAAARQLRPDRPLPRRPGVRRVGFRARDPHRDEVMAQRPGSPWVSPGRWSPLPA